MKPSKNTITTLSTLEGSKAQITSSRYIIPSVLKMCSSNHGKKSPQRAISIMEEHSHKTINTKQQVQFDLNVENRRMFSKNKAISLSLKSDITLKKLELADVVQKIFFKKKRYCFQVLKQFYLFPDQSQSSINSLSIYDPLIFHQEIIHSLVKILQTRLISNKIWGFLNLKMMPYLKAAKNITQKVTKIRQKTIRLQKKTSFELIKRAAQNAISVIADLSVIKESRCLQINTSYLQKQNKEIQCDFEEKKQRKSFLNSNTIQQQVKPLIKNKPQAQPMHRNTTKIYTRQEYEIKYGKIKENNQNLEPKVIKISTSQFPERKTQYHQQIPFVYTYEANQKRILKPTVTQSKVSSEVKCQDKSVKYTKSPKKYNIIHYHERPRQIRQPINFLQQRNHSCATSAYCSFRCVNKCCYCQHSSCGEEYRAQCCTRRKCQTIYCDKFQKSDIVNQTRLTENFQIINGPKSIKHIHTSPSQDYELSELQSRIEYLNFLKSLVKEQDQPEFIC